ncbi:MAG: UDP-N-acetylmuramoyl-tripeptide--D-alanyl-D-alanine ligase [Bacteroidales bacterium]|nr:UDP-N-acetylmuramoyl-tripeptide--D-alanyl-D-alanine ligase [Bacteroidales bacterium]
MDISKLYKYFQQHPVVCTDSRAIIPDSIFFALKGANFDGNRYAIDAVQKGAAYAVTDNNNLRHPQLLHVADTLQALQQLACYHRKRLQCSVLAITGSNGKTTTKELISSVLAKKYNTVSTQGNLNNHIGVPLTLLRLTPETDMAVIEMGANHPGEIRMLCDIALPDCGLITNVGKAHLEGFGSFEGVISTKTELYAALRSRAGTCFVNADNDILMRRAQARAALTVVTYGTSDTAWLHGTPESGGIHLTVRARFPHGWLYLKSNLTGAYNCENILAATCVGVHFGVGPFDIATAIAEYTPNNNRSQIIDTQRNRVVMDAYNANPASMNASLKNFIAIKHPNKAVILGDMRELGSYSQTEHQAIADFVNEQKFNNIIFVGKEFAQTKTPKSCQKFPDTATLMEFLANEPLSHCLILVKGSHSIGLEKILPAL